MGSDNLNLDAPLLTILMHGAMASFILLTGT
jgi:hypothetical protein